MGVVTRGLLLWGWGRHGAGCTLGVECTRGRMTAMSHGYPSATICSHTPSLPPTRPPTHLPPSDTIHSFPYSGTIASAHLQPSYMPLTVPSPPPHTHIHTHTYTQMSNPPPPRPPLLHPPAIIRHQPLRICLQFQPRWQLLAVFIDHWDRQAACCRLRTLADVAGHQVGAVGHGHTHGGRLGAAKRHLGGGGGGVASGGDVCVLCLYLCLGCVFVLG
jgi:hypothetical protein